MRFRLAREQTDSQTNAWTAGRFDGRSDNAQLLFGQMYEDASIEKNVLAGKKRIFCIASAGCTAIALAGAGHQVTAVDVNPEQIAYVKARLRGGEIREGYADRLLSHGRRFLPVIGWGRRLLHQFLELEEPGQQIEFWQKHLDTRRWRYLLDVLLNGYVLRMVYSSSLTESLPQHFGRIVRRRIEHCWASHANLSNPYAWRLLIGRDNASAKLGPDAGLNLTCADAATYLEACPPASFDGFTISNIFDGATAAYRIRLLAAIRSAASRGAVLVQRSFGEPSDLQEEHWASRDRAMLWGSVSVTEINSE